MKRNEKENKKTVAEITRKEAELSRLATSLFGPVEKNPYYLDRGSRTIVIKNIAELRDNLDVFTEEEALWLASWIEYLGDRETAVRIRETPAEFKEIIIERHGAVQDFLNGRREGERRR
ncbi:MAG: hypothetical protein WAV32_08285 [Halobacteriota archaeon]